MRASSLFVTACLLLHLSASALPPPSPSGRRWLLWLVPYVNSTTQDYQRFWQQIGALSSRTQGLGVAASAYALKHNGSLGYADTAAGEATLGYEMEAYGLPALRGFGGNLSILGMLYFTHQDGIAVVLADPTPFIDAVVAKVVQQGLHGMDLDYEPQSVAAVERARAARGEGGVTFSVFLSRLAAALAAQGCVLTLDAEGGSPGSCASLPCADWAKVEGLLAVNTMDTFNIRDAAGFKGMLATDLPVLGDKWAPGFEPANLVSTLAGIVQAAVAGGASQMASWAVHEWNTGLQPEELLDNIASFLT